MRSAYDPDGQRHTGIAAMETHELLMTALRAVGVYLVMLVVVRISGKRAIGNFTAFDLLVALMLGEVVDEIIYGDVTFAQGMVAIGTVALVHYGNSWLSYWDHGLDRFLEGAPAILVKNGEMQKRAMRKERMNEKDVMSELRLNNVEDIREVKLAIMENDGEVSVLLHEWAEPLRRGDVDPKERERMRRETGGREPEERERTDADHLFE
jgi:uncharacterized membrane protein YcaP (DUF421 family)